MLQPDRVADLVCERVRVDGALVMHDRERLVGLGRHIIAARVDGAAGQFITLTWPGYTGALQGMAPGRFSAAINQAPMRSPIGAFYLDWAANRVRVSRAPHLTPAHLLRRVFEDAPDFVTARRMLIETPVCAPAIFTLAGLEADDTCVIERQEETAVVVAGDASGACAANDWQMTQAAPARGRGCENVARVGMMTTIAAELDPSLRWLREPVLNANTRLVLVADARHGHLIAQGFEQNGPATRVLELRCPPANPMPL